MDILPGKCGQTRLKSLLLLLNLLVARTLGDCPKPELAENIVLTNEALLMNEFPDDVEISLTCANGYVKDTGSGIIKCTGGTWGDLDLTCKNVTCNMPEKIANGIDSWVSDDPPKYGENIHFLCNEGYKLSGKDSIMCTEDGEYDFTAPQCLEDVFTTTTPTSTTATTQGDCPKPEFSENIVLTNEALLMNEFPDDVEISLTCANGYVKDTGSGIIKCTGGTWGDLDLTCKRKDCGVPPSQPFMSFDLSQGTLFGAMVTVSCDKGYLVKGSSYKHCNDAGWTGKSTKCEIVTCNMPEKIANGIDSWDSDDPPKYGENITFFCNEGYILSGKDSIMCTEDGEYDFTAPQCLGVTKEDVFTTTTPTPTTATTQDRMCR